jgi:hypothetical protein
MFDERWAPLLRLDGASEIEIGNYRRMYAGGFCDGADALHAVVEAARVLDCRGECSISKKYDLEMALAALDAAKEGR